MNNSGIEWTKKTWNPIIGCSKISVGCANCYAEKIAVRLAANPTTPWYKDVIADGEWNGKTVLVAHKLTEPLKTKKTSMIFVGSMTDLFHESVPYAWLDKIFAVMALCPQHTFLALTKRHDRMKEYVCNAAAESGGGVWSTAYNDISYSFTWPLPNVWLGVTAENQARVDERVPILLDTPAAKRFVSIEPMLGAVDTSRWIRPTAMMQPGKAPKTWSEWNAKKLWPDWVPEKWRSHIEGFWSESYGRSPVAWLKSAIQNNCPPHGAMMTDTSPLGSKIPVTGRFLHTWNNMCVLIDDGGKPHVTSTPVKHLFDPGPRSAAYAPISWLICGGETGPGARPMHPDWARGLRDQCIAGGVPFFFKHWGEWAPRSGHRLQGGLSAAALDPDCTRWECKRLTSTGGDGWSLKDVDGGDDIYMQRVGKKLAGHLLDGQEWQQIPEEYDND